MNVKELIEELNKYPDNMTVVVNGMDDGYNNLTIIKSVNLRLVEDDWYDYLDVSSGIVADLKALYLGLE
jgi:hypothetical protein